MSLLLKGGMVYTGGSFSRRDILTDKGRIVLISEGIDVSPAVMTFSCEGKYVFPGFTDVHVHLREPGFSYKETMRTGGMAAAHGGFTCVCAMPNLAPAPDSAALLAGQSVRAAGCAVRIFSYGCITESRKGERVAALEEMAPFACAFSDDGSGVNDGTVMEEAMIRAKRVGKVIAAHCEDSALARGGCVHDGEFARAHALAGIPSESEYAQIERDLYLAEKTGAAYHVCHVSAAESVRLIRRAKARGIDVTCETAPHYLFFDDSMLEDDGRFKMNPPIRSARDRDALLEGIADGTVDMIATDHAPHSAEEKSGGLAGSLMGVPGLESAFPASFTALVKGGVTDAGHLAKLMSLAPSRRFSLPGQAGITRGAVADLTVVDMERKGIFDAGKTFTMAKYSPFDGLELCGAVCATVVNGEIAWKE